MDKLCMWQLLNGLDEELLKEKENRKDELDWMQVFYQEVVEPQYVFVFLLHPSFLGFLLTSAVFAS
jgi:hypothetical protein